MMYRKIQIELLLVGCLFVLLSCAGEKASVSESASSQISVLASDTLLPVKRDGLYGYADITGNVVIPCQWIEAGSFREGLAQIMNKKRKIGFIDKEGREVIPCQWRKYSVNGVCQRPRQSSNPPSVEIGRIMFRGYD